MTLALHWNFAEDKSLVGRAGPVLDFARSANVGTYFDSDGVMQTAAADTPRFGHNPLTLESLGLLIERERTNICVQSENLSATWSNTRSVDTQAQGIAPDGTNSANKLTDDSSTGTNSVRINQGVTLSTSTSYAYSVYLKADQLDWARLIVVGQGALAISAFFDLTNGVVGATTGADNTSEFIQDVGNGWYRCTVVFDSDAADTTGFIYVDVADANNDVVVALDGTSSILVWGAQLEVAEYPTSYIKTVTTALTSGADICNSDLIGEYYHLAQGTLYVAAYPNVEWDDAANTIKTLCDFANSTGAHRFYADIQGNGRPAVGTKFLTTFQSLQSVDEQASPLTLMRIAGAQQVDDVKMYAQGTGSTGDTSASIPASITHLNVGSIVTESLFADAYISELRYYNERVPDAVLEDMSNGIFYQDTIFSNGTALLNDGMVSVVHVASDYAGDAGDVFINGTRHTATGLMYVNLLGLAGEPSVFINGILHTHSGIRMVRMSGSGEDWPEGFNTDADGYQLTDTGLSTSYYIRGIARQAGGDMPITF